MHVTAKLTIFPVLSLQKEYTLPLPFFFFFSPTMHHLGETGLKNHSTTVYTDYPTYTEVLNAMVKWLALLFCIQETHGSNLVLETGVPD
jgi:hypothetical protein